jgi:hypothetical protein
VHLHDPANHDAIGEHVEVIVVPFAGGARSRGISILWSQCPPVYSITSSARASCGLLVRGIVKIGDAQGAFTPGCHTENPVSGGI